jgi:tetratricopeptide (TPR) repeat protein
MDKLSGAEVALKRFEVSAPVVLSHVTESEFSGSIVREFSLLAGLRHPNIINVLDYGLDDERRPFFTMELLDAQQTLTQACQAADFLSRISLVIQMLEALRYLHRRQILHRDLKPSNVLVLDGTVRVLDFGLAALGNTSGERVGTLTYMAPETLRSGAYVPASDLYAVGVMLYEIFSGELPFQSGDILGTLTTPPDLSKIQPAGLQPIIGQLLQKEPSERFPDTDRVIEALSALIGASITQDTPIRESYLQSAPFIGRAVEMAQLSGALSAALAGVGGAILIGGESGVGKSRLLSELRTHCLIQGGYVLAGQSVREGGLPYQLWREPIAHLVINADTTDFEAGVLAEALADVGRLIGRSIPIVPPLSGEPGRQRLAQTLIALMRRFGQPLLLLLEDLQWAGESLSILAQMVRVADTLPLLIIGTFRTDEVSNLPSSLPEMSFMPLSRLSYSEIGQLAAVMIGAGGQREDVIARLQRESDGNVFFLIETIRFLSEQFGQLAQIGAEALPATIYPESIAQIMAYRLSFVPDWARPLLNLAAVTGRTIEPELLTFVTDTDTTLDNWLYACANAAILEIRDNQWRFAHDKLRESLLAALPDTTRHALHQNVAVAIETLHPNEPGQAKRLANHWDAAGNRANAIRYSLLSGEFLARIGEYTELRILIEHTLTLLDADTDDLVRARVLKFVGDSRRYSDLDGAQSAYEDALALYQQHGKSTESAHILLGLAIVHRDRGEREQAERLIDRTLTDARRASDENLLMNALNSKARLFLRRGDYEGATTHYQESLAIAYRLEDAMSIATYLMNLGAVACMQGKFDEGKWNFQQAEQVAQTVGATDTLIYSLLNQANIASDHGDYATAETYFERCTPMIEALGDLALAAGVYYDRGDNALRQGQLDHAETWYLKCRALAERVNNQSKWADGLHGLGKVSYLKRRYAESRDYLRDSLARAEANELIPEQVSTLHYLTRTLLQLGDVSAARNALVDGLQLAQTLDAGLPALETLSAAIQYLVYQEEPTQAAELYGLVTHHSDAQEGSAYLFAENFAGLQNHLDERDLTDAIERGSSLDLATTVEALRAALASNSEMD